MNNSFNPNEDCCLITIIPTAIIINKIHQDSVHYAIEYTIECTGRLNLYAAVAVFFL